MIKEWLAEYKPKNEDNVFDALREIMQEITLAALSRTDFFERAAFYGGTALRILYGLNRYSEDLDFSLLERDPFFSLEPYFSVILSEFESMGLSVRIREKVKKSGSNIDSAFLKSETIWKELILEDIVKELGIKTNREIKIKIVVDKEPPLGFQTEERLLTRPFSFYVKCFTLPSLFAGKMHALLFRKWKSRVKGRDWYDLEWYIRRNIPLDLHHFLLRARDTGDWGKQEISAGELLSLIQKRIEHVSIDQVKDDITRFIQDPRELDIWSPKYFTDLISHLKFS